MDSAQLQMNLSLTLSVVMLLYLALAMPFVENLSNIQEIVNELCLYFTLIMLTALETFSAQILFHTTGLDSLGDWVIFVISLTILFNLSVLLYAMYKPFKESLEDRDSTKIGRCLRYCCKVRLPETRKCFCNCCTCGDEAKEVQSEYARSSFFSIQPLPCLNSGIARNTFDYESSSHEEDVYSDREESKDGSADDSEHLDISSEDEDHDREGVRERASSNTDSQVARANQ